MTRPICVRHSCEMRVEKNGIVIGYRTVVDGEVGRIIRGDSHRCPVGFEVVVTSFANQSTYPSDANWQYDSTHLDLVIE